MEDQLRSLADHVDDIVAKLEEFFAKVHHRLETLELHKPGPADLLQKIQSLADEVKKLKQTPKLASSNVFSFTPSPNR